VLGLSLDVLRAEALQLLEDVADVLAIVRDAALILVSLIAGLVLFLIYSKVSAVLNAAKRTMKNAEEVTSTISSRIAGPAAAGSGLAFGAGKMAAFVMGFSRKKKKKKGGEDDG
jgi:hypothetical protein